MIVATSRGLESVKDLLTGMGLIQDFDYFLGADKHSQQPLFLTFTYRESCQCKQHEGLEKNCFSSNLPQFALKGESPRSMDFLKIHKQNLRK